MSKVIRYKIIYKQKFMGEIITNTYNKWYTSDELEDAISTLYDDPHVIEVDYIETTVEKEVKAWKN